MAVVALADVDCTVCVVVAVPDAVEAPFRCDTAAECFAPADSAGCLDCAAGGGHAALTADTSGPAAAAAAAAADCLAVGQLYAGVLWAVLWLLWDGLGQLEATF